MNNLDIDLDKIVEQIESAKKSLPSNTSPSKLMFPRDVYTEANITAAAALVGKSVDRIELQGDWATVYLKDIIK